MIVYYSSTEFKFIEEIDPLSSCLNEHLSDTAKIPPGKSYKSCPAFQDYIKNTFVIRSAYDYELIYDKENKTLKSPNYSQEFFNTYIAVRDLNSGLFSYLEPRLIFFAEKPLKMQLSSAYLHNALNRHVVVPGVYDIGQHFRKLECAMHLFHSDILKIKEKDPLYYVKFLTDEKIEFKYFWYKSEVFEPLYNYLFNKRDFTKKIRPLKWYYENTLRNKILKEIKNNLL